MTPTIPFEVGFYGWILCIAGLITFNWWLIRKRKKRPSYWGNFLYRAFSGVICLFIMHPAFDPLGDLYSWIPAAVIVVYEVTSFYLSYDPVLNKTLGNAWNYRGETSGWIETYFGEVFYYALKIICLILLPLSILKIMQIEQLPLAP